MTWFAKPRSVARALLLLDRRHKRMLAVASDLILCLVAVAIAFSLRVGALYFSIEPFLTFVAVAALLFWPIFALSGVYDAIFRFTGIGTIQDLAKAMAFYAVPLIAIFMIGSVPGVPRTIAILHPIIFFGLASFSRMAVRHLLTEVSKSSAAPGTVLIYGAGAAGMQLALSLRHEPDTSVAAFVDDDERLDGQRLEGLKVIHTSRLAYAVQHHNVHTILLALPNITRKRRREIVESLRDFQVKVRTLPQIRELVDGNVTLDALREIQIEDLLGRDPVAPNELLLGRSITGKTICVTGAGGSIGSELVRQIASLRPRKLILVEMTEYALYQIDRELRERGQRGELPGVEIIPELLNVTDAKATLRVFRKWRPHTVFHAAAYKHVPLVEANVVSGIANNILATRSAADAAIEVGAERFILISTDKAVRPTNVMGASKRVCEMILQALAGKGGQTRFAMVRFGNVLGSSGSVVPHFQQQIRNGGPVTVTHREVTRYFMTIPEAAQLVIQAGAMAEGGEVYLLDMGTPVRIYDLARTMIELSGLTIRDESDPDGDIEIVESGLRPGEKLYEELLIGSDSSPTTHPRISRARERTLPSEVLGPKIVALIAMLDEGQRDGALEILCELVPEYAKQSEALMQAGTAS